MLAVGVGKTTSKLLKECITAIHSEAINMQRLIEKLILKTDQKRQALHKESLNLKNFTVDIAKDTQFNSTNIL